jgi:hypothetical protein
MIVRALSFVQEPQQERRKVNAGPTMREEEDEDEQEEESREPSPVPAPKPVAKRAPPAKPKERIQGYNVTVITGLFSFRVVGMRAASFSQ